MFEKQGVVIHACRDCGVAGWTPPPDFRPAAVYDGAYFADGSAAHGYDDYAGLESVLRRNFARRANAQMASACAVDDDARPTPKPTPPP